MVLKIREGVSDRLIQLMVEWSEGNFGAAAFLSEVIKWQNFGAQIIMDRLEGLKKIRGGNLYILYADLCSRDIKLVLMLCQECPSHILEDACSRQDYSGRELVAPYLKL